MAALVEMGVAEDEARACVAAQYDAAEGAASGDTDYPVLPCNWQAVQVFAGMPGSCWEVPAMGGAPRGLRRDQLVGELTLRGVRRRDWPALFERLRVMESAALEVLRARPVR